MRELQPGAIARADALFRAERPPWCRWSSDQPVAAGASAGRLRLAGRWVADAEPVDRGAGEQEAGRHDHREPEGIGAGLASGGGDLRVDVVRHARERLHLLAERRIVDIRTRHEAGKRRIERGGDRDEQQRADERRCGAADRVVDRRAEPGVVDRDRAHQRGRERRDQQGDAEAEHDQGQHDVDERRDRWHERRWIPEVGRPGRRVGRDPRQPEEAGRHDQRSDGHEDPGADAGRQLSGRRGEERQEQRDRQANGAGGQRRVPERALPEEALEGERDVERAVDHERRQVHDGEVPRAKERRRDERLRTLQHQDRDGHGGGQADDERHPRHRILPVLLLATGRAEREAADGDRDDRGAEPVEVPRGALVAALRHARRGPQRQEHERDVDEERQAPRQALHEDAAEERTDDRGRRCARRPEADRAPALLAVEERGDDREAARDQDRAERTLENPRDDQDLHRRGEAAGHRRGAEADQADAERPPPPVVVADRAGQDQQRGEHREVRAVDVREAFEPADERGRQLAADRLERDVHDRRVEEHDGRPEDRGRQNGRALAHGAIVASPTRCRSAEAGVAWPDEQRRARSAAGDPARRAAGERPPHASLGGAGDRAALLVPRRRRRRVAGRSDGQAAAQRRPGHPATAMGTPGARRSPDAARRGLAGRWLRVGGERPDPVARSVDDPHPSRLGRARADPRRPRPPHAAPIPAAPAAACRWPAHQPPHRSSRRAGSCSSAPWRGERRTPWTRSPGARDASPAPAGFPPAASHRRRRSTERARPTSTSRPGACASADESIGRSSSICPASRRSAPPSATRRSTAPPVGRFARRGEAHRSGRSWTRPAPTHPRRSSASDPSRAGASTWSAASSTVPSSPRTSRARPLPADNGAPVRLVAPGRRGLDWIKWLESIEVA